MVEIALFDTISRTLCNQSGPAKQTQAYEECSQDHRLVSLAVAVIVLFRQVASAHGKRVMMI